MNILIVEDDTLQANETEASLLHNFRQVVVRRISSESEFLEKLDLLKQEGFDVILLDVILRWSEPTPDIKELPPDVEAQGFHRAGIRCLNKILGTSEMRETPVIIYSVLGRDDIGAGVEQLPPHVLFLEKDSDEQKLVRHIRSLLPGIPQFKAESFRERLWESLQAKPGWLGFSLDLKKLLGRPKKSDN